MSQLFTPLTLRALTIPNRVWMPPMCQYSAEADGPLVGQPTGWHLQHYGARAAGGAGLIIVEATAVCTEGRISAHDLGLWSDTQVDAFVPLTSLMRSLGAVPAVQLAHAGRKAGVARAWNADQTPDRQWPRRAPSATAFTGLPAPLALTTDELDNIVDAFAQAAVRARQAGFDVVEVHAAHGYLLHEFLSPVTNQRDDEYGGSFENRVRLLLRVVEAVRAVWPNELPIFVRLSATDWLAPDADDPRHGWSIAESVQLAPLLAARGVDLIDVSSAGLVADAPVPVAPNYQVPMAAQIRATGIATAAVGLITDPHQAAEILHTEQADAVLVGRLLLRDAAWPIRAARSLGDRPSIPPQYLRGF